MHDDRRSHTESVRRFLVLRISGIQYVTQRTRRVAVLDAPHW
jgi:hypothetical protein